MAKDSRSSTSPAVVAVTAPSTVSVSQVSSCSSVCVLLVEDDHVLCTVSADTLNDLGYRAIRTSNGTEALAALERDCDIKVLDDGYRVAWDRWTAAGSRSTATAAGHRRSVRHWL